MRATILRTVGKEFAHNIYLAVASGLHLRRLEGSRQIRAAGWRESVCPVPVHLSMSSIDAHEYPATVTKRKGIVTIYRRHGMMSGIHVGRRIHAIRPPRICREPSTFERMKPGRYSRIMLCANSLPSVRKIVARISQSVFVLLRRGCFPCGTS